MFSGYGKETALKIAGIQGPLRQRLLLPNKRGLIAQGNTHTTVLGFAGTGTVDIGIQSLSGMFERGEKSYTFVTTTRLMNTGIQG